MQREELERDIVSYDKQKLISVSLKLFDSNKRLADNVRKLKASNARRIDEAAKYEAELKSLYNLPFWGWVNNWLERAIKRKKDANKGSK